MRIKVLTRLTITCDKCGKKIAKFSVVTNPEIAFIEVLEVICLKCNADKDKP